MKKQLFEIHILPKIRCSDENLFRRFFTLTWLAVFLVELFHFQLWAVGCQ